MYQVLSFISQMNNFFFENIIVQIMQSAKRNKVLSLDYFKHDLFLCLYCKI